MATTAPSPSRTQSLPHGRTSNLDVDWLLHGKRDFTSPSSKDNSRVRQDPKSESPTRNQTIDSAHTHSPPAPQPPLNTHHLERSQTAPQKPGTNTPLVSKVQSNPTPTPAATSHSHHGRPHVSSRGMSEGDGKNKSHVSGLKKEGRRSSWFSSLGHKISGGSSRNSSVDATASTRSPVSSPKVEFGNPFDKKGSPGDRKASVQSKPPASPQATQQSPEVLTHQTPPGARRPSVLVAAGTETKLDNPGFLSNALRRLSSSNAVTLGKGAGVGAICPRRVMNVDQHRERSKIRELDQNKLRRVAFCVDVEIAGVAAQAEEEPTALDPIGFPATSSLSKSIDDDDTTDAKVPKYKDKGEGAALKNPITAEAAKEAATPTRTDSVTEAKPEKHHHHHHHHHETDDKSGSPDGTGEKAPTRKKEKKKRSEAERKERRERKRRHAEANGLVPLELTRDDDSSDSSPSSTPGTSTPRNGNKPTTDPLRIYKRCCQLRESSALSMIKDQISKPAATLAEAPGTVAVIDLTGSRMPLLDIITLSDWLAVVPVRKLILDDCGLSDEAVRIVLAGLLGCKSPEQARNNRRLPRRGSGKPALEQMGVIERLSMKNNSSITSIGWKHIATFMHMSHSLCAIDLTGVPYPKVTPSAPDSAILNDNTKLPVDMGALIARAVHDRLGSKLEELILSGCRLSTADIQAVIDAAIKIRIRRLGMAGNDLDTEGLSNIVRYAISGVCEGLDLGSNNLHGSAHMLADAINESNPMFAISLADCHLTTEDLGMLLPKFCELKNFKFIDLSRNHELFHGEKNAVPLLRKCLPKMMALKRLHLADADLMPEHVMALADIFPDCPSLAHISLLENKALVHTMNSKKTEAQEEAAAFLASLMTATRLSSTLVAVELEVPTAESSEVVRALSSQVIAYSLRNMERSALNDFGVESKAMPDGNAPEVLLHLVGHMDGYSVNRDNDDPAPDEDYLIASTGVVRALSVCLDKGRVGSLSRQITPTASGTATPRQGATRMQQRKRPKDVSRELCESAKKIRMRLRPALVKEDQAGNTETYRRLHFLDQTLAGIIQRFEDEFPDNKSGTDSPPNLEIGTSDVSRVPSAQSPDGEDPYSVRYGPHASNTSLASKALMHEEGRMLRFGQTMRRELLKPVGTDDYAHGTSVFDDPEPAHLEALRGKLAGYTGEEIRARVEKEGADSIVKELQINAEELKAMAKEDPVGFEALRNSALMREIRSMNLNAAQTSQPTMPGSFNSRVTK